MSAHAPSDPGPRLRVRAGRRAAAAVRIPLLPADRGWVGITSSLTIGPLDLPPVADLRRAAGLIAAQAPTTHLGHRLDASGGCWIDDGLTPERAGHEAVVVHEEADAARVPYDQHLHDLDVLLSPDAAVRWVVSGDHLSLRIQHATGDSGMLFGLMSGLLTTARTGEVPAALVGPTTARALTRTVWHHYGRHPSRLLAKAAVVAAAARRTAVARRGSGPSPDTTSGAGPDAAPAPEVPWTPREASESAVVPEAALRALRRWGRDQQVPVGVAALQVQLTHDALTAVGLPPAGSPTVLADVRRFAPEGTVVHGNFVSTLTLQVDEAWSAASAEAALDAAVDRAEPLTALAVGVVTRRLRDRRATVTRSTGALLRRSAPVAAAAPVGPPPGATRPADLRPVVTVSTVVVASSLRVFGALPVAQRRVRARFTPGPREGVTFCFLADGRQLYVHASFDEDVFPRALVREAVRLIGASPVELLEGRAVPAAAVTP